MNYRKSIINISTGKRVFILDVLLLILLASLFYSYTFQRQQVINANNLVLHTYKVINSAEKIQALIAEADLAILQPAVAAGNSINTSVIQEELNTELQSLKSLSKDNEVQAHRLAIIDSLITHHPVFSLAQRTNEKTVFSIDTQLRNQLSTFKVAQYQLLRSHQIKSAEQSKSLGTIRLTLYFILLSLILVLYFYYRKMNFRAMLSSEQKQKLILLDNILDAVIITDGSFTITGFNKSAEAELNWKKEEVLGTSGRNFFKDFSNEEVEEIWQSFQTKGQWIGEVKLAKEGAEKYYQVNVTIVKDAKDTITNSVCLVRDVTAQKLQVQQLLQRTESLELQLAGRIEEAHAASQKAAEAFIVLDKNFRHVQVHDKIATYYNASIAGLYGKTVAEVYPAYLETPAYRAMMECMETGLSKVVTLKSITTGRWIECNMQPTNEGMVIYFKDVTEVHAAQKEIKRLSKELQKTRDEDRSRIANDLHEDLGQQLTSIKVALSYLSSKIKFYTATDAGQFKQLSADLENAIHSVRKIAFELKPAALEEAGLSDAVKMYAKQFERTTGIKTKLANDIEDLMIDNDTCVHMYRILQEALTNVARHAKATEASVQLTLADEKIVMRICDNGDGFDAKQIKAKRRGLAGIQQRAKIINATCTVNSRQHEGTIVEVLIPLFP